MKHQNTVSYRESAWGLSPEESLPVCNKCKHHTDGVHCMAFPFPKRIPDDILFGKSKHLTRIDGQTGDFIFQPMETKE